MVESGTGSLTFGWNSGTDAQTSQNGLTYNVMGLLPMEQIFVHLILARLLAIVGYLRWEMPTTILPGQSMTDFIRKPSIIGVFKL